MNDTHKYNELLRILDAIVEDLKRMLDIPVIPKAMGNCSAPIAVYCFTCMDFLGTLIQEFDALEMSAYRHISDFIVEAFHEDDVAYLVEHEGANSLALLHYGFTRTFMPMGQKGCSVGREQPSLFSTWAYGRVLDADRLAAAVIRAVKNFDEMLRSDVDLLDRAWSNYKRMMRAR